ncbi:MAG TPA: alpha/beta fold hydrolase [Stellaceae bacterium]|nr:alpha/beta fold hydrolase [Stellaceae bacterium]
MDSLALDRSPGLSAADFPPFLARAPWWGGDLQTLRNYLVRPHAPLTAAERLYLPMHDGSCDRLVGSLHRPAAPGRPSLLVLLIHGLTGCEQSHYMVKTASHLLELGFTVLRLNLRGAGASRPSCRFQYYAGRSEDFADALAALPRALTRRGLAAIGYSLGANMLLKYLGERGSEAPLKGAIAVSAPLDLAGTARRMMWRRNSFYQRYLLRHMRAESLGEGAEITGSERAAILGARSIWEYDHRFSAPRNGFRGAENYYERNAARRFLDGIAVPTLVIHALDDPWIPPQPYLGYDWRRNPSLVPLLPAQGGHIGFEGRDRRTPWHDLCAARFLAAL